MNTVSTSNLWRVFELKRALLEGIEQRIDFLEQNVAGVPQQKGVCCIDHIGRGQTIMNKSRGFADIFRQVCGKRDYIVVGRFLDLVYSLDRKTCTRLDVLERFRRNRSHLRVNFTDGELNFQPLLEFALFSPKRAHLGQCVSFNHFLSRTDIPVCLAPAG